MCKQLWISFLIFEALRFNAQTQSHNVTPVPYDFFHDSLKIHHVFDFTSQAVNRFKYDRFHSYTRDTVLIMGNPFSRDSLTTIIRASMEPTGIDTSQLQSQYDSLKTFGFLPHYDIAINSIERFYQPQFPLQFDDSLDVLFKANLNVFVSTHTGPINSEVVLRKMRQTTQMPNFDYVIERIDDAFIEAIQQFSRYREIYFKGVYGDVPYSYNQTLESFDYDFMENKAITCARKPISQYFNSSSVLVPVPIILGGNQYSSMTRSVAMSLINHPLISQPLDFIPRKFGADHILLTSDYNFNRILYSNLDALTIKGTPYFDTTNFVTVGHKFGQVGPIAPMLNDRLMAFDLGNEKIKIFNVSESAQTGLSLISESQQMPDAINFEGEMSFDPGSNSYGERVFIGRLTPSGVFLSSYDPLNVEWNNPFSNFSGISYPCSDGNWQTYTFMNVHLSAIHTDVRDYHSRWGKMAMSVGSNLFMTCDPFRDGAGSYLKQAKITEFISHSGRRPSHWYIDRTGDGTYLITDNGLKSVHLMDFFEGEYLCTAVDPLIGEPFRNLISAREPSEKGYSPNKFSDIYVLEGWTNDLGYRRFYAGADAVDIRRSEEVEEWPYSSKPPSTIRWTAPMPTVVRFAKRKPYGISSWKEIGRPAGKYVDLISDAKGDTILLSVEPYRNYSYGAWAVQPKIYEILPDGTVQKINQSNSVYRTLLGLADFTVSVFPNPAGSDINVEIHSNHESYVDIHIYDMLGKRLISDAVRINIGYQSLRYTLGSLPKSVYLVSVIELGNPKSSKSKLFMKTR